MTEEELEAFRKKFARRFNVDSKGVATDSSVGTDIVKRPGTDIVKRPGTDIVKRPGTDIVKKTGTDIVKRPSMDLVRIDKPVAKAIGDEAVGATAKTVAKDSLRDRVKSKLKLPKLGKPTLSGIAKGAAKAGKAVGGYGGTALAAGLGVNDALGGGREGIGGFGNTDTYSSRVGKADAEAMKSAGVNGFNEDLVRRTSKNVIADSDNPSLLSQVGDKVADILPGGADSKSRAEKRKQARRGAWLEGFGVTDETARETGYDEDSDEYKNAFDAAMNDGRSFWTQYERDDTGKKTGKVYLRYLDPGKKFEKTGTYSLDKNGTVADNINKLGIVEE